MLLDKIKSVIKTEYKNIDINISMKALTNSFSESPIILLGGNTYILKVLTNDQPYYFLEFQNHLYKNNIPCPKILKNIHGHLFSKLDNKKIYIQEYINGNNYWLDELPNNKKNIIIKKIGYLQKKMHNASKTFNISSNFPEITFSEIVSGTIQKFNSFPINNFNKQYHYMWMIVHLGVKHTYLLSLVNKNIKLFLQNITHNKNLSFENFGKSIVTHGDWNHDNLLIGEENIISIIDFDNAKRLPIYYDVGSAAACACYGGNNLSYFLKNYLNTNNVEPDFIIKIQMCYYLKLINSLLWQINNLKKFNYDKKIKSKWWIKKLIIGLQHDFNTNTK